MSGPPRRDAADLHRFEEDRLRLLKEHFAFAALPDRGDHLGRDLARLAAGDGAVGRVREDKGDSIEAT